MINNNVGMKILKQSQPSYAKEPTPQILKKKEKSNKKHNFFNRNLEEVSRLLAAFAMIISTISQTIHLKKYKRK
jgi:hypothetical protein